jgi:hypothetical protein
MTATYWEIGRRIVEHEQSAEARAGMLGNGVTHIAVATDHVIESFGNDLWPGYKTGEGVEPDLLAQFPPAGASPLGARDRRLAHRVLMLTLLVERIHIRRT